MICSLLLSNAIDSPAPVFGDFKMATAPPPPAPPLTFLVADPVLDRLAGVGGSPVTIVDVESLLTIIGVDFASKSRIVSRTRDFRAEFGAEGKSCCLVGEFSCSAEAVPGLLLPLDDLTGLGLEPSFASSRLGSEIGLGILDFAPPPGVRDPFRPPPVVFVATLVVVEVARLLLDELPAEPQTQPLLLACCDFGDANKRGMSSRRSGVNGRSTC